MRQVIKRDQVQVEGARAAALPARPAKAPAAPASGPCTRVRALRVEGRVRAVEITCSCGEASLVELDYVPTPDAPARSPGDTAAAEPAALHNEVKS